jgi:hypothetical protein
MKQLMQVFNVGANEFAPTVAEFVSYMFLSVVVIIV